MTLKLILISPSGTLIKDKKLDAQLMGVLGAAIKRLDAQGVRTAVWSNTRWTVKQKPLADYLADKAGCQVAAVGAGAGNYPARRKGGSVDPILAQFNVARHETLLVGNGEEDLLAGVNNHLLLVRPDWYASESEYGFSVSTISELERFCTVFGLRKHPIYWSIYDGPLQVRAMGPYSTKIQQYAGFGTDALKAAKYEAGSLEFWHRLIVSSVYFSDLIAEVDYIASFPGHEQGIKPKVVNEVMALLGKCFRKTFFPDLIERHATSIKSAYASASQKTFRNQLNTIRLNAYPHPYGSEKARKTPINLHGKTVLIVDDFCTNGRSLDAARAYIEAAGGKAISFAWLKTINSDYLHMKPAPTLQPFQSNSVADEPPSVAYPYVDGIEDGEAPAEIASILDRYKQWAPL